MIIFSRKIFRPTCSSHGHNSKNSCVHWWKTDTICWLCWIGAFTFWSFLWGLFLLLLDTVSCSSRSTSIQSGPFNALLLSLPDSLRLARTYMSFYSAITRDHVLQHSPASWQPTSPLVSNSRTSTSSWPGGGTRAGLAAATWRRHAFYFSLLLSLLNHRGSQRCSAYPFSLPTSTERSRPSTIQETNPSFSLIVHTSTSHISGFTGCSLRSAWASLALMPH
jgi:hypothetical protein